MKIVRSTEIQCSLTTHEATFQSLWVQAPFGPRGGPGWSILRTPSRTVMKAVEDAIQDRFTNADQAESRVQSVVVATTSIKPIITQSGLGAFGHSVRSWDSANLPPDFTAISGGIDGRGVTKLRRAVSCCLLACSHHPSVFRIDE